MFSDSQWQSFAIKWQFKSMDVCQYCVLMEHWSAWVFKMEHWSAWVFKHSCTSNAGIKKKFKWSVCWQQLNILDCAQALKNPLWVIFWQMIWFYGCHQSVTVNVAVQHSGATHDISQSKMSRYTKQSLLNVCIGSIAASRCFLSLSLVLSMAILLWQGFIEFVLYISNFHCFGALHLESGPGPWLGHMCWWAVIIGIYCSCIESEPKCLKRLGHCFLLNHK